MGVEPIKSGLQPGAWPSGSSANVNYDLRGAEGEGVEPSSPFGSSRFERGAVANRLALPC